MPQLKKSGQAMLGAEDARAGEPVEYEVTLDVDGEAIHAFACLVRSVNGGALAHLYGRPLVLDIPEGPTFGVTMVHIKGDEAVLQLRQ
jgi:hypothetical protein